MSIVIPALPADVYIAYVVVKRKKNYLFCRICSIYICNAHGIIKLHRFSILLGQSIH